MHHLAVFLAPFAFSTAGAAPTALPPATALQDETTPKARIAQRCQALIDELHEAGLPGVSAALVLPESGEVVPLVAGFASREEERVMRPEDLLLSGSVGKTYVTAAVHHLVAAGKLDLDALAAEFLGEEDWYPRLPNAGDITVRQLLRHQTGIPRYVFDPGFWEILNGEPDRVWEPHELLAYVFDAAPLFAASEGWAYSDTNYIVLGLIVERVSGEAYYDYVQEHFLGPLELTATKPSDSRTIPGITQGYVVASRQFGVAERVLEDGVFVFNPQFEWCGGGYASAPADLARWTRALFSGAAIDGPYLDTLLETVPAPQLGGAYGLGVIVRETELGEVVGHDGFMPGFTTATGYFPDHDIAATLQVNTDDPSAIGRPLPNVLVELAAIAVEELAR